MRPISDGELARQRVEAESILVELCTIQTVSRVSDGAGGSDDTYNDTYTNVPCKLFPKTATVKPEQGEEFTVINGWGLRVYVTQPIEPVNRVVIDSETYLVISVADEHTWNTVKLVDMKRID